MLRAVIFDVDNTLYDYDRANEQAFQAVTDYAQRILGIPAEEFPALHQEADKLLRLRTGRLCAAIHSRLLRYQLVLEEAGRPLRHARQMAERYWSVFLSAMEPDPAAAACLDQLKAAGYTLGIGTNMTADYQFAKLERLGLLDKLDFVVTSEEAGAEKPEGRLFACCVEKAGCQAAECVFVGDNWEMDVLGAERAGLRPVWLSAQPLRKGAAQISSLRQLPGLLQSWQADGNR